MLEDRPQFTLTLTLAEAFAMQDAMTCLFLVANDKDASSFRKDRAGIADGVERELAGVSDRLDAQTRPVIHEHAQRLRERAAETELLIEVFGVEDGIDRAVEAELQEQQDAQDERDRRMRDAGL